MNSILFIYIFSLFVITSPNFIFKIPVRSYWISIAIHAVIFSCILYFTYDIVNRDVVESAVVNNDSNQYDGTASGTTGTASGTTGTAGGNETIIIESSDSGYDSEGVKKNADNIMKLKEQQNQKILDNANDIVNLAKTYSENAAIYAQTAYHAANQINGASTAYPATHTTTGAAIHTTTTPASTTTTTPVVTSKVTIWFKSSTGGGIQLSEITFYDANGKQLTVESTEKPSHNYDTTTNKLNINRTQNPISNVYDNDTSTKWWSWDTYGSITFTLRGTGTPSSYTFTTGNDNNPNINRTPVTWNAYYKDHVNEEHHTGQEYYTSDTQQSLFTLPADGKHFTLLGNSTTSGSTTSGSTPTTTPITQENIQTAVNAWITDPTTATATYGHISNWDTSAVTDMSNIFENKSTFNDDISAWNVSNVTNMQSMFNQAHSFKQPIGNWDVSKVTNMASMFQGAKVFNQPINTPKVTVNTGYMFYGVPGMNNSKVSSWSSKLTNPKNYDATYSIANGYPNGLGMFG